jgi:glyoxylase-like metal-dependent hydrolase (beta-lactamase superfamily II)
MWNDPAPAPEYRFGWKDRSAARASLERILAWDFDRIVISHGDLVERDAKNVARRAWRRVLSSK